MPNFQITITDQDALDALAAELARVGGDWTQESYLSDFVTTQFRNIREPQLLAVAQAKVDTDPDLKAFREKKALAAEAEALALAEAAEARAAEIKP